MKHVAACVLLAACGPSVGVEDTTETGADTSTTDVHTSAITNTTTASTTSPNPTTATTIDPSETGDATTMDVVDSGDESADTVGFIQNFDGYSIGLECDVWAQDCPRGEKCVPASSGALEWFSRTLCAPIADDPAPVGAECSVADDAWSGVDDCESGSVCWFVDETLQGTCAAQCQGGRANPQCPKGHSCEMGFEGTVTLCLPSCDPLAPACPQDQTCMHGERPGIDFGHFVCQATAPVYTLGDYGAECGPYQDRCAPGLACVVPDHVPSCAGSACCTLLGDLSSPPVCPDPTQSCITAYPDGDAPAGLENLCFCGVPE